MGQAVGAYACPVFIGWLILAQTVRWSEPVMSAVTWLAFAVLVTRWAARRAWPGAIRAIVASPLSPMAVAAAVSALVNGGWSRAADWTLYAVMLACFLDARPDLDRHLLRVGKLVITVCLVEWAYLAMRGQWNERIHLLGNPNVIAAMICLLVPLLDWPWRVLSAVVVVATGSRAGMVGLGLWGAAYAGRWWGWAACALVSLLMVAARPAGSLLRLAFWHEAVRLFSTHPFIGVGPGLYRYGNWVHAHNLGLTWLAETGLIGLLALLVTILRYGRRSDRLDLSPIIAVIPFFIFDDMTMYWAVSLGALYLVSRKGKA